MLSLFPSFFDWNWYVPFVFRIFLAYYLFNIGLAGVKRGEGAWKLVGIASTLVGVLFVAGVLVQASAMVGALISWVFAYRKSAKYRFLSDSRSFYVLLGLVSLSLLFLGPGPYAFDLPL